MFQSLQTNSSPTLKTYSLPALITACNDSQPITLPDDFHPRDIDILCGRGRGVWDHSGNRQFKTFIAARAQQYATSRTKMDKGALVASMVDKLREAGVLFVKKDTHTQRWRDIGDYQAREKTSHAIRDHIYKKKTNKDKDKSIRKTITKTHSATISDDERSVQQSTVVDIPPTQQSPQAYPTLSLSMSPSPSPSSSFDTFPPIPKQSDIGMSPRRVSQESTSTPDLVDSLDIHYQPQPQAEGEGKDESFDKLSNRLHQYTHWAGRISASNTILLDAASSFLEDAQVVMEQAEAVLRNEVDIQQQQTSFAHHDGSPWDNEEEDLFRWSEMFPIAAFDDF